MAHDDPKDLVLTHPAFERFVVLVAPNNPRTDAHTIKRDVTRAFKRALATAGQATNTRWKVKPVATSSDNPIALLEWDIVPTAAVKETIAEGVAWEVVHALRGDPTFADAEPIFSMILDDYARGIPPEAQEEATEFAPDSSQEFVASIALEAIVGDTALTDQNPNWSALMIDLFEAWAEPPRPGANGFPAGKSRGAGIRIAHPDSGYIRHGELYPDPSDPNANRILWKLGYDFISSRQQIFNKDGHHGLSAASVLTSHDNPSAGDPVVFGIAPEAEVVPYRVSRTTLGFIPSPVLLFGGVDRLREAIYAAIEQECHVISICLGWFGNRTLHRAVQAATAKNIIIVAAAGNYVKDIIRVGWPARYPECIAVAGCNVRRHRWRHSGAGPEVDISGPAEDVWRACFNDQNQEDVERSSGTTFATVTVAGVAALWLAHWGRKFLLDMYEGVCTITDVFRLVLQKSATPFDEAVGMGYGAGIVNALGVLKTPLPTVQEMKALRLGIPAGAIPLTSGALFESAVESVPRESSILPVLELASALPESEQRATTASFLGVAPDALDTQLAGMGDELAFHILTRPEVRKQFRRAVEARKMGDLELVPGSLESMDAAPTLAELLPVESLSPALRARMQ